MSNVHQYRVSSEIAKAQIGKPFSTNYLNSVVTMVNSEPQAKKVCSLVVNTAANSTAYVVTINGIDVTYTSDASGTKAEIADGLAEAINAEALARMVAEAVSDGIDTITITGLIEGNDFSISNSDANMTLTTTTAAADADSINFGRLVASGGFDDANELCFLPKSTYFTALTGTVTITYNATSVYTAGVKVNGQWYHAQTVGVTNLATTAAALKDALNGVLPANTVVVTNSSGVLTFTAEIAGLDFDLDAGVGDTTATTAIALTKTAAKSLEISLGGVAMYEYSQPNRTIGGDDALYGPNEGVKVFKKGEIWVAFDADTSLTYGDEVYVETSGANSGLLYNAASPTRIKLPREKALWLRKSNDGNDLALLKINV